MQKGLFTIISFAAVVTMVIAMAARADAGDESWKESWPVNTVWYQIFPERFNDGDKSNEPEFLETYNKKGELDRCVLSGWDDEKPDWKSKYGGDLKGIDDKIDWLAGLGVSGVWLNPIFKATSNHKYNTADYGMVDPAFGDRAALAKLVSDLHSKNIRIILDGVFNHTGYEFWAFQDIVDKGEKSTYRNWYFVKDYPVVKLWEQNAKRRPNYECWWGVGSLPKLNVDDENARGYIIDVSKGWMRLGIDGWRLDVPEEIKSETFWREWSSAMRESNPDCYLTGEIWGEAKNWIGDAGIFDATMNYHGFRVPVMKYFTGRKIKVSEFDRMLAERRALYPHSTNCLLQNLLSSHDTARILSVIKNGDSEDGDKERKDYDKGPAGPEDIAKYRVILMFQMTYVGAPMIYYGDEIGMTGGKDPDCRRPMIWDEGRQNLELLEYIKKLISARNSNREFRTGEFRTLLTDDRNDVYAYERKEGSDESVVILNYSPSERKVALKDIRGGYLDLMTGMPDEFGKKGLNRTIPPYSGLILKKIANKTEE